ncbi:hypothetical protein [uncultured Metabacillus sp.]|uniref:hypothetical protein n=1 Tax=uncultured Metabacillus sp. TaxID=2860135 RepID=UPI002637780C|nr:hypothetical protein [uncultured Metabacillus sp.]
MTLYGMMTVCIVCLLVFVLVADKFETDLVMFTALVLLMVSGILSPEEALIGFANEATVTVGALFIVIHSIKNTYYPELFTDFLI